MTFNANDFSMTFKSSTLYWKVLEYFSVYTKPPAINPYNKSFNIYKLIMVVKKKIELDKTEAIYLFINNTLLQAGQTLG